MVLELAQQLFVGLEILPHIVGPNEYIKDLSGVVCDTPDLIWVLPVWKFFLRLLQYISYSVHLVNKFLRSSFLLLLQYRLGNLGVLFLFIYFF